MTTANKITIFRILLIPAFVGMCMYYGASVQRGEPNEWQRYAAIILFVLASTSDALDGFIARRFNQKTKLGVILDPIADKGLLLSAIITLGFAEWPYHFPIWFPLLVISRDVTIVLGSLILHFLNGEVRIKPHWTGKTSTFFQMVAITWILLQLDFIHPYYPVGVAGFFTLISGIVYIIDGIRQLHEGDHAEPKE